MQKDKLGQETEMRPSFLTLLAIALLGSCAQHSPSEITDQCPISELKLADIEVSTANITLENGGTYKGQVAKASDWSLLFVTVVTPDKNAMVKRLVIYIPGGPRTPPPLRKFTQERLHELYDDGQTEVLLMAHSGNQTSLFDGAARIQEHGMQSISCDRLVAEKFIQVRQRQTEQTELVVHGTSYGTLLALSMGRRTSLAADKMVLQAPWLFPISIDEMVNTETSLFVRDGGATSLANRADFRSDMENLYKNYLRISRNADGLGRGEQFMSHLRNLGCVEIDSQILFLLAEHEDRTDIDLTMQYLECLGEKAELDVAEGAFHGSELAVRDTRETLTAFLSKR